MPGWWHYTTQMLTFPLPISLGIHFLTIPLRVSFCVFHEGICYEVNSHLIDKQFSPQVNPEPCVRVFLSRWTITGGLQFSSHAFHLRPCRKDEYACALPSAYNSSLEHKSSAVSRLQISELTSSSKIRVFFLEFP